MIKFKQKTYAQPHVQLDSKYRFLPDSKLEKIYGKCKIVLIPSKFYNSQVLLKMYKPKLRALLKDLESGFLYEDGPAGGDTHYFNESDKVRGHICAKEINTQDQLVYTIYRPKVENGEYIQVVYLMNRVGHNLSKTKTYSE